MGEGTLLSRVHERLALELASRGRAVMTVDGSLVCLVSADPGDPPWLIAPYDDPDALVLFGGCGVQLGLLTCDPANPSDIVEQVLGVLDGNLTEYVSLDDRGALSVGYSHAYNGGGSRWGRSGESDVLPIRHHAWNYPQTTSVQELEAIPDSDTSRPVSALKISSTPRDKQHR